MDPTDDEAAADSGDRDVASAAPSPSVDALVARGRAALLAGDAASAAGFWEQALVGAGRHSAIARDLRLELALIYENRLGMPERAIRHLESFVSDFASDRESTRARHQLCTLAAGTPTHPLCGPQPP